MKLSRADIRARAAERPPGYEAEILARATRYDDETVELEDEDYRNLVARYRHGPPLHELAGNFAHAIARWVGSGFAAVSERVFLERLGLCEGCEHWNGHRCLKCGCLRAKLHLATEKCPLGKWPN